MPTSLQLQHFAVLSLSYSHTATSAVITCVTNNPCHLTCYYTDKEPVRHSTSRVLRGLALPWGAYWCFVAWRSTEQIEPGDTLSHSFEIPDWSYCQTKWFCFKGTVAGAPSPSASALFKHHHPGAKPILFEHYNTGDDTGHIVAMTLWEAQTFTPQVSHTITSFKLKLYRVGLPGEITVGIRATSESLPTGPDLVTGTTAGNTLTTDKPGEWREFMLPGGPALLAPIQYAGVVRAPNGYPRNYAVVRADSTNPTYRFGAYCNSGDSGESWTRYPTSDQMFEEWGIPI